MKYIGLLFLATFLISCGHSSKEKMPDQKLSVLKYAEGFSIQKEGAITRITIQQPYQGAVSGYTYLLVPESVTTPPDESGVQVITVPVRSIVCTSTTHIPHLDYLGITDKLVGFPTTDYISSESMRKRVDAGDVKELGIDKGMDIEALYSLHPGLVMGYTMSADLGQLKKIQELGIPVVINAEYLEKTPLGRAEWIKFTSLFFGKEKEADSIFQQIEKEYLQTKELVSGNTDNPSVMSGIVYGDTWFMPGGQNYGARLLEDAATDYLWKNDASNGFLELSFESVYQQAKDADLWIGVGSFTTLEELASAEKRYKLFHPYQTGNVYTYNARIGAKGGNLFLELGYLRPDLILKDLVKIAHPDILAEHELFFHKKLE